MNSSPLSPHTDTVFGATALFHASLQRLASQSAACKLWSIVLAAAAMLFAAGRPGGESLLLAAAPGTLLALVDAGYVFQARRTTAVALRLPSINSSSDAREIMQLQVPGSALTTVVGTLKGIVSLSVWPFYLGLTGMVVGIGIGVLVPTSRTIPTGPVFSQPGQFTQLPGRPLTSAPSFNTTSPSPNLPPPTAHAPQPPRNFPSKSLPPGTPPPFMPSTAGRPQGAPVFTPPAPAKPAIPIPPPTPSPVLGKGQPD